MAALTKQTMTEGDGTAITFVSAAGGGDTYPWSERSMFVVKNGSGGAITVSMTANSTSFKQQGFGTVTKAAIAKSVADGATALFDTRSRAFQGATGNVAVTYSGVSSVTVAAIELDTL
jgi:hypothetical protein